VVFAIFDELKKICNWSLRCMKCKNTYILQSYVLSTGAYFSADSIAAAKSTDSSQLGNFTRAQFAFSFRRSLLSTVDTACRFTPQIYLMSNNTAL